jgi:hypothetical protein
MSEVVPADAGQPDEAALSAAWKCSSSQAAVELPVVNAEGYRLEAPMTLDFLISDEMKTFS